MTQLYLLIGFYKLKIMMTSELIGEAKHTMKRKCLVHNLTFSYRELSKSDQSSIRNMLRLYQDGYITDQGL